MATKSCYMEAIRMDFMPLGARMRSKVFVSYY